MIDDMETFRDRALACFIPPLPKQKQASVWAELQNLAAIYQSNIRRGKDLSVSFHFFISWSGGPLKEVNDPAPRGRGRPREYAAARLVDDIRSLLAENGCQHGSTHLDRNKYGSRLVDLAKVVHEMAGECLQGGWRNAAEMANANWEISERTDVFKWRFALEYGGGAPPRSLRLVDTQIWDLINRDIFREMPRFIPQRPWPGNDGPPANPQPKK